MLPPLPDPVPAMIVRVLDSDSFDSFRTCANFDAGGFAAHGVFGSYAFVDGVPLCHSCYAAASDAHRAKLADADAARRAYLAARDALGLGYD